MRTSQTIQSVVKTIQKPRVAIVGGSFGGYTAAECLAVKGVAEVILVERAKYHAHSFVFPKFSVHAKFENESHAFIPLEQGMRSDKFKIMYSECKLATGKELELANGQKVPYDYLVIATGCGRTYPAGYGDVDQASGVAMMRNTQKKIEIAKDIAVIGAGAFGVQLATDIKWIYGDQKNVTLYNSRAHVLPRFGDHVWQNAEPIIQNLGVKLVQNARPLILSDKQLKISQTDAAETRNYDLIFNCTGQTSTIEPFSQLIPSAISGCSIVTDQTLQVPGSPNIFAIGDINAAGPHMAKGARAQAAVAAENILRLIEAQGNLSPKSLKSYQATPKENTIKLTLGYDKFLFGSPTNAFLSTHEPNYRYNFAKVYKKFQVPFKESKI